MYERREQLREAIVTAEAALDADLRAFDELRQSVRDAEERCAALRGTFEEHESRIKDARRALEAVRAEAARLDVARATAESDLTHLSAACVETVQATLDEVSAEVEQFERDGLLASPRPVDDAPEPSELEGEGDAVAAAPVESARPEAAPSLTADEMVLDLRAKIDRMGPVNLMAIDQFDYLETRHQFLTTQRKDLIDSIAATSEAIKKIDKTTRERFTEAFTVINQNFEKTFTTLFGGGRAGLMMLDESDALETGIDIIAQPPGKKLQNVNLLSGGEKSLTAIALLMAVFSVRPSPFFLLDEVDAALDDANAGRFNTLLKEMAKISQFLLISHNKSTIEVADTLYGVTMQEPGLSKLVTVDLVRDSL
jgi:chromosome segregation protein